MELQKSKPRFELFIEITVHVLTWCYIFLSPLFFNRRGETINWDRYLHGLLMPITACITFYLNYFVLIPKYLLNERKLKWYFAINVLLFVVYQVSVEVQGLLFSPSFRETMHKGAKIKDIPRLPPKIFFVVRGFIFYVFAVGASVALKLSLRWRKSEQARAEAELGRSQAELKNLKNQINPHFLLNTLNNIYALVAFDQEKAQQAIHELSRLLRYMLYENQTDRVSLNDESDFLQSYIALMRLRLYNNVDLQVNFDFPKEKNLQVAPLIFISLIENAFKHGVSSSGNNFIHITLKADEHHLVFCCENSNTPKNKTDKSPGGIGLQQVASRLENAYPKCYEWKIDLLDGGATYRSVISIYDKPIKH